MYIANIALHQYFNYKPTKVSTQDSEQKWINPNSGALGTWREEKKTYKNWSLSVKLMANDWEESLPRAGWRKIIGHGVHEASLAAQYKEIWRIRAIETWCHYALSRVNGEKKDRSLMLLNSSLDISVTVPYVYYITTFTKIFNIHLTFWTY